MTEILGGLGLVPNVAAAIWLVYGGWKLALAWRNGRSGNGNQALRDAMTALTVRTDTTEQEITILRKQMAAIPDRISEAMSKVAARAQEVIAPLDERLERLEDRLRDVERGRV